MHFCTPPSQRPPSSPRASLAPARTCRHSGPSTTASWATPTTDRGVGQGDNLVNRLGAPQEAAVESKRFLALKAYAVNMVVKVPVLRVE